MKNKSEKKFYNENDFSAIFETDAAYMNELGFTVYGKFPQNKNEVAITKYHFNVFKTYGFEYGEQKIDASAIVDEDAFLAKNPYFDLY